MRKGGRVSGDIKACEGEQIILGTCSRILAYTMYTQVCPS